MVDTQRSSRDLPARRGTILDRNGRMLAVTRIARNLFLDPRIVTDRNTFSEKVGYELDLERRRS